MAVKSYYDILGVAKSASKIEIKKAYFSLVKKYPPEQHTEEFKEYRKAYEVLYDDNARAEYDSMNSIPAEFQKLYSVAQEAMATNDPETAIEALEWILDLKPGITILESLLAEAYTMNGNTGKAIKIFEELVKKEPLNASYQADLAQAYYLRGYNKKAMTQYQYAIKMDPENLSLYFMITALYLSLGDNLKGRMALEDGLRIAESNKLDNLNLLTAGVMFSVADDDLVSLNVYLDKLTERLDREPVLHNFVFNSIMSYVLRDGPDPSRTDVYLPLFQFMQKYEPSNEDLKMTVDNLQQHEILDLLEDDENVSDNLVQLTAILIHKCDCTDCKLDRFDAESNLLFDITNTRKALKYLQKNYPDAFELNADFYRKLLNPKKEEQLILSYHKKYKRYQKLYPEYFEDDDIILDNGDSFDFDGFDLPELNQQLERDDDFEIQKPYVRMQPKVGRNDPCPCGSGKKYKKCCGANK